MKQKFSTLTMVLDDEKLAPNLHPILPSSLASFPSSLILQNFKNETKSNNGARESNLGYFLRFRVTNDGYKCPRELKYGPNPDYGLKNLSRQVSGANLHVSVANMVTCNPRSKTGWPREPSGC